MTDFGIPSSLRARRETASFGDLVTAHWRWQHAGDDAHERYESMRARFEAEHGEIVDDYWSEREPAAVAITCLRSRRGREQWALHRNTARLAAEHSQFASLLRDAARESVRVVNVLSGMTQRIATSNLYSLTRDVMASLEDRDVPPTGLSVYKSDLRTIEDYTKKAGAREAQIVYLKGLMRGLLALFLLAPLLAVALSAFTTRGVDPTLFVGCIVAGSFGATMSVLMRMSSGKFDVNHELGREYVTNLGLARPYIGAVFALLLYFAVQGELVQQVQVPESASGRFAFFVASGFLIGFSERFAKEIVRSSESGASGSRSAAGDDAPVSASGALPAAA